jgi:hypothetical protein
VRSRRLAALPLLVASVVHADVWEMQAVIGNDAFDGVLSHTDDDGFTADFAFALWRRRGDVALGGSVLDRMITSRAIMRRTDLLELFARAVWTLDEHVAVEGRAGPTIVGDLGGQWVQSRWHRMSGTGPRDPRETPSIYEHDFRAAGVIGLRGEAGYGGVLHAYGTLDGQVAVGATGVSFGEAAGGLRAGYRLGPVSAGVFGEVALGRYRVEDAELAMPGAYRPGWQVDRRIGVQASVGRYRASFEYHTNETSSGQAFSVITLERR